jgi:hypothetical protein
MIINELTLTSIDGVISDFIGNNSKKEDITSTQPIEIDLAGVQLLIAYQKENQIKIDIELNESSLELFEKTGFLKYIKGNKFIL